MYLPSTDMKSLGFCSIYKESFNIISSNQKLFTQIAIFLALPVSIVTVIGTPLSSFLFPNIEQINTSNNPPTVTPWIIASYLAFKLAYTVLSTCLSLLSFSSVTYLVACIYTEHTGITFKTTLCAFKKAWKRLVLTFLAEWVVIFGCFLVVGLSFCPFFWAISSGRHQANGFVAIIIISLVMIGGILYTSIIWIFSRTVANLETIYGFKALRKSKSLIKGNARRIIRVFFPISSCSGLVAWIFLKVVVNGDLIGLGHVIRIGCGFVCLPVMAGSSVFAVVVLTVTYLVCKADKEEPITKSDVMDHLDIFVDGYSTPLLKAKDEQNLMA